MTTRVLLVEDYGDARQMYAEYLEHKGYEVLQAADGSQALAHAVSDRTPNVVVLDFALPGMDGFEVARRLRTTAKTALVPIIMFTAHDAAVLHAQARAAGCDLVVEKPVIPQELATAIEQVLGASGPHTPPTAASA